MDTSVKMTPGVVLVLVDMQNDFLPGGALGVPSGDQVVPVLNQYIRAFRDRGRLTACNRARERNSREISTYRLKR